jgi:hypothetical protein
MGDRDQLNATRSSIIQKHFRKGLAAANLSQLQSWHKDYKAADDYLTLKTGVVQDVQLDTIDEQTVETCIAQLTDGIHVAKRFCADCQHLFDDWPDLGDPHVKDLSTQRHWPGSGADWKHTIARQCHTLVLEAAARKGCRFCAFLVEILRDAGGLDIFRKLERRLSILGDEAMASLSLQDWGKNASQSLG